MTLAQTTVAQMSVKTVAQMRLAESHSSHWLGGPCLYDNGGVVWVRKAQGETQMTVARMTVAESRLSRWLKRPC